MIEKVHRMPLRKKKFRHRDKIRVDQLFNYMVARPVGKAELEKQPNNPAPWYIFESHPPKKLTDRYAPSAAVVHLSLVVSHAAKLLCPTVHASIARIGGAALAVRGWTEVYWCVAASPWMRVVDAGIRCQDILRPW